MSTTILITLIAMTALSAFLCWGGYSSLRMSGKSKSEAATRAGLVFAAILVRQERYRARSLPGLGLCRSSEEARLRQDRYGLELLG